ncbi:MAG: hypothetical protein IJ381_08340 [Clostridia bacterium]|nr:hypothetical protein [Clostridia bacterium]
MKKLSFALIFISITYSLCIFCHGAFVYTHHSGITFNVLDDWYLSTSSYPHTMTSPDGDIIQIYITDVDYDSDYTFSESQFYDILDQLSIDAEPMSVQFSSYPFYYADQEIETKKSLQELIDELTYDEYVSMFGEHLTSFNEYFQMKTKLLGIPGTKENPYYYFYSAKACALYQSPIDGSMFVFYYSGSIDSLSSFESFLNSLEFKIAKPAVTMPSPDSSEEPSPSNSSDESYIPLVSSVSYIKHDSFEETDSPVIIILLVITAIILAASILFANFYSNRNKATTDSDYRLSKHDQELADKLIFDLASAVMSQAKPLLDDIDNEFSNFFSNEYLCSFRSAADKYFFENAKTFIAHFVINEMTIKIKQLEILDEKLSDVNDPLANDMIRKPLLKRINNDFKDRLHDRIVDSTDSFIADELQHRKDLLMYAIKTLNAEKEKDTE